MNKLGYIIAASALSLSVMGCSGNNDLQETGNHTDSTLPGNHVNDTPVPAGGSMKNSYNTDSSAQGNPTAGPDNAAPYAGDSATIRRPGQDVMQGAQQDANR